MTSNLATQLREGTSKSHSMAENVSFVKSFLGGVIDKESYRKLVSNLYFVYSAMEEAMDFTLYLMKIKQILKSKGYNRLEDIPDFKKAFTEQK